MARYARINSSSTGHQNCRPILVSLGVYPPPLPIVQEKRTFSCHSCGAYSICERGDSEYV